MPRKPVKAPAANGSAAPATKEPKAGGTGAARIKVQVRYYQRLREVAAVQAETYLVDADSTVAGLLAAVIARHPGILEFAPSLLIAINADYAQRTAPLAEGDIVDLMPPVSGG